MDSNTNSRQDLHHRRIVSSAETNITNELLLHIDSVLDELSERFVSHTVILAGDFNQLGESEILNLGLLSVDIGATHKGHALDRSYTSEPLYQSTKVVAATIKTEHKVVIARNDCKFFTNVNS